MSEQILPLCPWSEALRAALDAFAALDPARGSELARLLPELGAPAPPAADQDSRRLFEAVVHALRHASSRSCRGGSRMPR